MNENPAQIIHELRMKELTDYANNNLDFQYLSGSRLYGTFTKDSDYDKRGVFLHTLEKKHSILKNDQFEEVIHSGDDDVVSYELSRFANLLKEQNPRIIEALWVKDDKILKDSPFFQALRENRFDFLHQTVIQKFLGYAASQFKMAQKLEKKIYNKPVKKPYRTQFLTPHVKISSNDFAPYGFPIKNTFAVKDNKMPHFFRLYDTRGVMKDENYEWLNLETQDIMTVQENHFDLSKAKLLTIVHYNQEAYKAAKLDYDNYQIWLEKGNKDKLATAEDLGFLPKPMSHSLRILLTIKDLIDKNDLIITRPDSGFLLDVRNGKHKLHEVIDYYKTLVDYVKTKEQSFPNYQFNEEKLNEIVLDTYKQKFKADLITTPKSSFKP